MTTHTNPAQPSAETGFSLISDRKLLDLYAALARCRGLENHLRAFARSAGLPALPGSLYGHEATAVSAVSDLLPGDTLTLCQPAWLFPYLRQAPLAKLLAPLRAPSARPRRLPFALRLRQAMAAAARHKQRKNKKVAVAYCGVVTDLDAAAQTQWRATLRHAASRRLPLLFLCPTLAAEDFYAQAEAFGLPSITVDGNDAVAIYRVVTEAVVHARRGNGPTLIECVWTPAAGGRAAADSLRIMENYLTQKGLWKSRFKAEATAGLARELAAALPLAGPRPASDEW